MARLECARRAACLGWRDRVGSPSCSPGRLADRLTRGLSRPRRATWRIDRRPRDIARRVPACNRCASARALGEVGPARSILAQYPLGTRRSAANCGRKVTIHGTHRRPYRLARRASRKTVSSGAARSATALHQHPTSIAPASNPRRTRVAPVRCTRGACTWAGSGPEVDAQVAREIHARAHQQTTCSSRAVHTARRGVAPDGHVASTCRQVDGKLPLVSRKWAAGGAQGGCNSGGHGGNSPWGAALKCSNFQQIFRRPSTPPAGPLSAHRGRTSR